ncbi:peptidase U62 modulator of DNA gyrase [Emticicia oligotrophica DSM 17448]|uniref:Peptidase U62 modulator of DNA gyrase n=1 Tax=Emticicia oligotrophica (strain DSM 17448 / CIP 109782 / MTCC 6937 / GPTSA100-15) TaxID=929562 RepID=A0ABM5N6B3_EMTOG|nr:MULTISPECIES: TldD/PmbA family protein [Emticicia]AFK04942.1 peptidase U62 modulator of DNA gyrase [Emticicia oligotrophica DSM 17448]
MKRRDFIQLSGLGFGGLMLPNIPIIGNSVSQEAMLDGAMDVAIKKRLADAALNAAKAKGATYTDVRIGRYLNQFVVTREDKVQNIVNTESYGVGVRVIANGCWGFAAVVDAKTEADTARAAEEAVAIAKANAKLMSQPVILAPQNGYGEVSWKAPIQRNAFEVPIKEKVDLLLGVNDAALKNGANYVNSVLFLVNEQKYFASSDGSYIDQDIHRIWPIASVTAIDPKTGKFETRQALSAPMGMGYEYLQTNPKDKVTGITTRYNKGYDMLEDVTAAAKQAKEKLTAKSVEAGKYDLVLDPSHLWLTIHESVGHPLELDRVLGYEANFAGTSFATLDKWQSKNFNYGSKEVNFFADKTQVGSLGAVGWDDEGVKTKRWDLVKDGTLVNYQAIRDQVHILGEKESHGCCYADSWSSVQFQRMANVSLAAGKTPLTVAEMIKDVKKGIYIIGDGSFSIDQQRYNFQFGGQLYYEIKDGQIAGMLKDVAYQSNTQEFWNSCVKICDERDYRLGGSFFDGKGQPSQSSAVSHGSATARFNGVNVINTARKV